MYQHLLTWKFPSLVEIEHTQNKLKFFIEKPLENKNYDSLPGTVVFFFFWWVCLTRGGWKREDKDKK